MEAPSLTLQELVGRLEAEEWLLDDGSGLMSPRAYVEAADALVPGYGQQLVVFEVHDADRASLTLAWGLSLICERKQRD